MKIILAILIVVACIFFREDLETSFHMLFKSVPLEQTGRDGVFSADRLSEYDGVKRDQIYLSLLGNIFDVTSGIKHYGQGGPYNYFVGKDGSRSFITGNFQDESSNKDHVLDLSCDDLFTLTNWKETLSEKYNLVGVLIGRYYDSNGEETEYSKQFVTKQLRCEMERQLAKMEEQAMPPCNMEWNVDTGTRVWCSKTSGGIKRNWIGVPRQLYSPGKEHPRCVCVNTYQNSAAGLLKEYEDCPATHTECTIKNV